MGFFDLNIPYNESHKRISTGDKANRLKLAVKAMELGYTGVAYNRTITGVMSEVDRCSISLFPLSSVLKVSPVSTAVNFHRRLLDVQTSTPFRQYTRLTVVVDTPAQGSALNSGNPVLKTYDIVAVRPLKQDSFDRACKNYEVDIIAIDFSENRFRLKRSLIRAAIERGVYFEITYSGLIIDAQLRRQMISNAKFLVDWTRGKNLIFSSEAPSVTELRGPNDVANLAFLLGFSMERAKAAVSKTCRSLLANALRKKKFYKEAIRVEFMSPSEQFDIEKTGSDDWLKWDPISSGEGDLLLDEMAKSFAASSKESKAIDFVSIIDELPSNGLHITDIVPVATKAEKPVAFNDISMDSKDPENCSISSGIETVETCAMIIEEEAKSEQQNLQTEVHEAISETNVTNENHFSFSAPICPPIEQNIGDSNSSFFDAFLGEEFPEEHTRATEEVAVSPVSWNEDVSVEDVSVTRGDASVAAFSTLASLRSHDELQNGNANSVVHEALGDVSMEDEVKDRDPSQTNHSYAHESSSERIGRNPRSSRGSISLPFKRWLKPSHFKKVRKLKTKRTIT